MRDVAIVSCAQVRSDPESGTPEVLMLVSAIRDAIERSGVPRKEIGFTCSGSADYLTGAPFGFVQNLAATGAWPPISESHVEMDGAWALYEAWVRLQHGDVDTALVFASGRPSVGELREVLALQLDPYTLSPLWPDYVSLAALQAQAVLASTGRTEKDLAEIAVRCRRDAKANPYADVSGDFDPADLLSEPYVASPLRPHDCPPVSDGVAAVVLVAGDRARELCERPAWIRGIDHRVDAQYPGLRDLRTSASAELAAVKAGVGEAPIEVAELSSLFTHEEILLRRALGLGDEVAINPSGGPLACNPTMVTGLIRFAEAFRQIHERGRHRVLAHATAGPCLQQNLVCVLEGD
ncbi:MAG: lipid-transfer protein [Proteobacteria bacterium]|nr:lipid-transfer protein [Pseudomonadota bacterium]